MAHPQNSPRGLFSKKVIRISPSGDLFFEDYSTTTALLDADSTGLRIAGGINISLKQRLTALSTGLVFADPDGGLPANVTNGVLFGLMNNSTGTAAFVNVTGTSHKYLLTTSIQPT